MSRTGRPPGTSRNLVFVRPGGAESARVFFPRHLWQAIGSPVRVSMMRVDPTTIRIAAGDDYGVIVPNGGSPHIRPGADRLRWLDIGAGHLPARDVDRHLLITTPEARMAFEVFLGGKSMPSAPTIAIQSAGVLVLNREAFALLGSPAHVQLLYDAEHRYLGMKTAEKGSTGAYKVSVHTSNDTYVVSIRSLLPYYNLEGHAIRGRYAAQQQGSIVYADLNQTPLRERSHRRRDPVANKPPKS